MNTEHNMMRRVLCDATLECEELEAVIAPIIRPNHKMVIAHYINLGSQHQQ